MNAISLQDLQRDPAAFIDRVQEGEHFVVSRDGRPVAELRPVNLPLHTLRPFGLAAGAFTVPDDFDSLLPEDVLQGFEGR